MKKCPQCGREYDLSMSFCLDDGAELLYGPASGGEPQTAILSEPPPSGGGQFANENATRPFIQTTVTEAQPPQSFAGSTEEQRFWHKERVSAAEAGKRSANRAAKPLALILLVVVVVLGGFFGYRYLRPAGGDQIKSIAVLPFQNRSSDADTDYLSDGLAESLIFRLTQLPGLKVSPASSVMRYGGKDVDVARIASELGVDAVMTGRLAKRGDNLNITVELIDARNNTSLWGEQYERKMSELLATQREIATTIVDKLQLKLTGDDAKGITKKYTDSNEAYQLYMRGRHSFAKRTKEEMLRSVDYFKQAVKLDPKFALAYARLSEVYGSMPAYPYLSPKAAFPEAKAAAQKALEIDPTLPEAHTSLAYSLIIYDWDWAGGERSFKRAIELDPNNANAHFRYGQVYLLPLGRFDEAISEIDQGVKAEPLDVNMGVTLAWAELVRGRHDRALELVRKIYEFEPNHPLSRWFLAQVLNEMGRYDESLAITEKWLQDEPNNQFALRDAGVAYARSDRRDKAEEMIRRYRELSKTEFVPTSRIAAVYGALGEMDKAFAEMEKAFEERDWDTYRMNIEVYIRPLRNDPRFAALLKRLDPPK
jgi:TolB-like protein/Flp pilus assembly protein TadD